MYFFGTEWLWDWTGQKSLSTQLCNHDLCMLTCINHLSRVVAEVSISRHILDLLWTIVKYWELDGYLITVGFSTIIFVVHLSRNGSQDTHNSLYCVFIKYNKFGVCACVHICLCAVCVLCVHVCVQVLCCACSACVYTSVCECMCVCICVGFKGMCHHKPTVCINIYLFFVMNY